MKVVEPSQGKLIRKLAYQFVGTVNIGSHYVSCVKLLVQGRICIPSMRVHGTSIATVEIRGSTVNAQFFNSFNTINMLPFGA